MPEAAPGSDAGTGSRDAGSAGQAGDGPKGPAAVAASAADGSPTLGTRGVDRYDSPAGASAGEAQLITAVAAQPAPHERRWPSPWKLAALGLLGFAVLRAADRLDG